MITTLLKRYSYLIILFTVPGFTYGQPAKVISKHFEALRHHDISAIASGYAGDAQVFSPNWEGAKIGIKGITEVYSRYFKSTPDLSYHVTNTILAGDDVIVEYTSGGTLSNPEGETPAYMKGKKYSLKYCALFTVKDGKIIKESDYFDQVAFLKQVGFFDPK